ncbi:MAG: 30S ribosomal protein S8 [Candidatus Dadabacteria bacterium]|nr:MAG: 30S ribosomal protein S8 [Candidatus Dadabacteria bacterium]
MATDSIADLLTRLRNAQRAGHRAVRVNSSKVGRAILEVLKQEGYIDSYQQVKDRDGKFDQFEVVLKYYPTGEPAMTVIDRISKPGRRIYSGVDDLPRLFNGLGVVIVSTSQGVMTDREARKRKIGGEVLAQVG